MAKKKDSITIKKSHFYVALTAILVVIAGLGGYSLGNDSNASAVADSPDRVIETISGDIGLNTKDFETCLDSDKYNDKISNDLSYGSSVGVSGTPTFFIGNNQSGYVKVVGAQPYQVLKAVIDKKLAGENYDIPESQSDFISNVNGIVEIADGHVLGDQNAPVTVIEFSDFECPFCGRSFTDAVAGIKKDYVNDGDVKFVYRHFPLSFHPMALPAAVASECAAEQGKFWEAHDYIFNNQDRL